MKAWLLLLFFSMSVGFAEAQYTDTELPAPTPSRWTWHFPAGLSGQFQKVRFRPNTAFPYQQPVQFNLAGVPWGWHAGTIVNYRLSSRAGVSAQLGLEVSYLRLQARWVYSRLASYDSVSGVAQMQTQNYSAEDKYSFLHIAFSVGYWRDMPWLNNRVRLSGHVGAYAATSRLRSGDLGVKLFSYYYNYLEPTSPGIVLQPTVWYRLGNSKQWFQLGYRHYSSNDGMPSHYYVGRATLRSVFVGIVF